MIAAYQIHNVLKWYTDRISKRRCRKEVRSKSAIEPQLRLLDEGRRDYLVDRLAADIVARIQREGPLESGKPRPKTLREAGGPDFRPGRENPAARPGGRVEPAPGAKHPQRDPESPESNPSGKGIEFVYNVISGDGSKKSVRMAIDDSDFLLRRIEEMAGQPLEKPKQYN